MKKNLSILELCHIGIFAAIIVVCAQIAIPLPGGVPMTLQAWGIALAGLVLGPKNGTLAALVYVMLGAVGVPVFAHFRGGMGVLLGPTGGFILSFPLMAFLAGVGDSKRSMIWVVSGLVAGTIVNWLCGMLYFIFITSNSLTVAFTVTVLPFIPAAIIRTILLPVISKSIKTELARGGVKI